MKRAGVVFGWLVFAGFCAAFAACGGDDSSVDDSADGAITPDGTFLGDGSTDGANANDGTITLPDGAIVSPDGSIIVTDGGRRSDGGICTPRPGGSFPCGGTPCTDSTSEYCIYGAVPNTCEPLPPECQCEETFDCACLTDNLICDDGGAKGVCTPHDDAGGVEAMDAASTNFFWLVAHHCSVR